MVKDIESETTANPDEQVETPASESRRLTASDDLEISTYLEIAEEKQGRDTQVTAQISPLTQISPYGQGVTN